MKTADPECLSGEKEVQRQSSAHTPIDSDFDWMDVEIDLPDAQHSRRRRNAIDEEDIVSTRNIILAGLRDGVIPESWIFSVACDDEGELDEEFEARLRITLGDLGVLIDEEIFECQHYDSPHHANEEMESAADEAIAFLSELTYQDNDPLKAYFKDMGHDKLLSREDEIHIATLIENGLDEAIRALVSNETAINEILNIADRIERGEVQVGFMVNRDL